MLMNLSVCRKQLLVLCILGSFVASPTLAPAEEGLDVIPVEGQPLAANARRIGQTMELLGYPLASSLARELADATSERDAVRVQQLLDPLVLFVVEINPEARVHVRRGPASAELQQHAFTPVLVKVLNRSTATKRLRIMSPQAGPVYGGVAELSMKRQQQEYLRSEGHVTANRERFLSVEMFQSPPLTEQLSGLEVEYAVALIHSIEAGKREATIGFDIQQGNQDLGFRGEIPVLFQVRPAVEVRLRVQDSDGQATMAKLLVRDRLGRIYPPQPKRLAPDLFFQPHIYRQDGEAILLPEGTYEIHSSRGPEYRTVRQELVVDPNHRSLEVKLERWIDTQKFGFYSGDHHIHAAGCAHYTSPTEGVLPSDMFRQVKGEGLNVGCVLTWGPCYAYQRQFFEPGVHDISERTTLLKYDLEISGFGSQALGHVCLLNLKDQEYPGSEGTSTKGWPTWTTPVMRWAKQQGGYTGYAHSASGIRIDSEMASKRLVAALDADHSSTISQPESQDALLPEAFAKIDENGDQQLDARELNLSHERAADQLPNLAIPEMNGVGAMEISVSTAEGVCDFISAMDTARIQEWNTWYHLLNCGFPLKVSGETDFPCMSSTRVGQGRVYVRLGPIEQLDFASWCRGLAEGRSYVSDGYAHAVDFTVDRVRPGEGSVALDQPRTVLVEATVAFAAEQPLAVAHGGTVPPAGKRDIGDTVVLHGSRTEDLERGGERLVEIIRNGEVVGTARVPADGALHSLSFEVPIEASSWIALRHFPQLHTNPVNVLVAGKPIRASRASARWCQETIQLLWKNRERSIAEEEREEAKATFERAIERYRTIAQECES